MLICGIHPLKVSIFEASGSDDAAPPRLQKQEGFGNGPFPVSPLALGTPNGREKGGRKCWKGEDCKDFRCELTHPPRGADAALLQHRAAIGQTVEAAAIIQKVASTRHWLESEVRRHVLAERELSDAPRQQKSEADAASLAQRILDVFDESIRAAIERSLSSNSDPAAIISALSRERNRPPFAVYSNRLQFEALLKAHDVIIAVGACGSGKTSQLPLYVADMSDCLRRTIFCVQPTDAAAKAAAATALQNRTATGIRVAASDGVAPCDARVIYLSVRAMLQRLVATDGVCAARAVVILDDSHLRLVDTDLLLGILTAADPRWGGVKVVLTTLNIDALPPTLRHLPTVVVGESQRHVVAIRHIPPRFDLGLTPSAAEIANALSRAAVETLSSEDNLQGHIICIVPDAAVAEIARAAAVSKASSMAHKVDFFSIFKFQTQDLIDAAIQATGNTRRVIFMTDAFSSLTIPGAGVVVDSGFERVASYSMDNCVKTIAYKTISQARAQQRAGHVGRCASGVVIRLYSSKTLESWDVDNRPLVLTKRLARAVATLRELKINPSTFAWPTNPGAERLESACRELDEWGGGKLAAMCQMQPWVARLVREAAAMGCADAGVLVVALCKRAEAIIRANGPAATSQRPEGEVLMLLRAYGEWRRLCVTVSENGVSKVDKAMADAWCREHGFTHRAIESARKIAADLKERLSIMSRMWAVQEQCGDPSNDQVAQMVARGFGGHLATLLDVSAFGHPSGAVSEVPQGLVGKRGEVFSFKAMVRIGAATTLLLPSPIPDDVPAPLAGIIRASLRPMRSSLKASRPILLPRAVVRSPAFVNRVCELERSCGCYALLDSSSASLRFFGKDGLDDAADAAQGDADSIKAAMAAASAEEFVSSGVRGVFCAGYELAELLFQGEFSTLTVEGLPAATAEASARAYFGVRARMRAVSASGSTARVVFERKDDASRLLGEVAQGRWVEGGVVIKAAAAGIRDNAPETKVQSRVVMSWPITRSTGKATIYFPTPESANEALPHLRKWCAARRLRPSLREHPKVRLLGSVPSLGDTSDALPPLTADSFYDVKLIGSLREERRKKLQYRAIFCELAEDVDEDTLAAAAADYFPLGAVCERKGDVAEGNDATSVWVEQMRPHIPFGDDVHLEIGSFFDHKFCKSGLTLTYQSHEQTERALDVLRAETRLPVINGQRVRFKGEFKTTCNVKSIIRKCLTQELDEVVAFARSKGVAAYEPRGHKSELGWARKFVAPSMRALDAVRTKLRQALSAKTFEHAKATTLTTSLGRKALQELVKEHKNIMWDHRYRAWRMFGKKEDRSKAEDCLTAIVQRLGELQLDSIVRLRKDATRAVAELVPQLIEIDGIVAVELKGCRIVASGTHAAVEALRRRLDPFAGLIKGSAPSSCGVCCDEGTDVELSLCGHAFHMECIAPMFTPGNIGIPLLCPHLDDCKKPLAVADVQTLCESIGNIRDMALSKYMQRNPKVAMWCPQPDCGQLLRIDGSSVCCAQCKTQYCTSCSAEWHEGFRCDEAQKSDTIIDHVRRIQDEILTLRCPACRRAFYDFDGCMALTCSNEACKAYFCALCCHQEADDQKSHQHVRQCRLNPTRDYFGSKDFIEEVWRKQRRDSVNQYLRGISVESRELANSVLEKIRRDLSDLRIALN